MNSAFRSFLAKLRRLPAVLALAAALPSWAVPWTIQLDAPEAREVYLAGEMTGWDSGKRAMTRDAQGRWALSLDLPAGQWLYKFVVDGKWIADPGNPLSDNDGQGGRHSFVLLGDGDWQVPAGAPRGTVLTVDTPSKAWGAPSRFHVYLPPGYQAGQTYPLLLLLHGRGMDADQWLKTGLVDRYMDTLTASGRIRPFIVAMPTSGTVPYTGQSQQFVLDELLPLLKARHGVSLTPQATAVAGMSMGGFGAFHLGMQAPHRFGLVYAMSGPFAEPYLASLPSGQVLPFQLALLCGSEDGFVRNNQNLAGLLKSNGARFFYQQSPGGHDWHYWNGQLTPMLTQVSAFFDGKKLATNSRQLAYTRPDLPRPGAPALLSPEPVTADTVGVLQGRWRGTWRFSDGTASGRFTMEVAHASATKVQGVLHWHDTGSSQFENIPFDSAPVFKDGQVTLAGVSSGLPAGQDPGLVFSLRRGAEGPQVAFTTHAPGVTPAPILNEVRKVQ